MPRKCQWCQEQPVKGPKRVYCSRSCSGLAARAAMPLETAQRLAAANLNSREKYRVRVRREVDRIIAESCGVKASYTADDLYRVAYRVRTIGYDRGYGCAYRRVKVAQGVRGRRVA